MAASEAGRRERVKAFVVSGHEKVSPSAYFVIARPDRIDSEFVEPPIFVITGQLASGKSTVARELLAHFDHGFCIDHDGVREMVVSGLASPLEPSDETERQFRLAIAGSAQLAAVYHAAGFAVAIEGAFDPWAAEEALAEAGLREAIVGIELFPPLDVALERNRTRQHKAFDPAILEDAIHDIDRDLHRTPPPANWVRIDNGRESVAETVERVLALSR